MTAAQAMTRSIGPLQFRKGTDAVIIRYSVLVSNENVCVTIEMTLTGGR